MNFCLRTYCNYNVKWHIQYLNNQKMLENCNRMYCPSTAGLLIETEAQ